MKRMFCALLIALTTMVPLAGSSVYADLELMEADEPDGSYPALNTIYDLVHPSSPLHVGNSDTGSDDWALINSQYNEPRNFKRWYQHAGVDIESAISNRKGRPIWASYTGTVSNIQPNNGSYGNSIETEHSFRYNFVTYRWRFFHAHMYSYNTALTVGSAVSRTTHLGDSGDTGLGCVDPCVHVHMELRPITVLNTNGGTRALPPNLMFNSQTTWSGGLDTTFMTRTLASDNKVSFRLTVKSNVSTAYRGVTFWYENSSGIWVSSTNWTISGDIYTMDLLQFQSAGTIKYYVTAENTGYDGSFTGPAYRPFRHGHNRIGGSPGSPPPPTDRPMTYTIS